MGACSHCQKTLAPDSKHRGCERCRNSLRLSNQRYYAKNRALVLAKKREVVAARRAEGLCSQCGADRVNTKWTTCGKCRAKSRANCAKAKGKKSAHL